MLAVCHSEEFVDRPPATIHATLADRGIYLCSVRTMYRILDAAQEVKERRKQATHPVYVKPELCAQAPEPGLELGHHRPQRPGRAAPATSST